jgi:hypothetical protein
MLERQPGKGLTQAEPLRSVMQNAKAMACKLGDLKNSYGTGHGRAVEPQVTDELDATGDWSGTLTGIPHPRGWRVESRRPVPLIFGCGLPGSPGPCHDPDVWHN